SQHHNSQQSQFTLHNITIHRSQQSANLKFSIFGNWDNGIVILFYLPDEVGGRRLRDEIGEATGERTGRIRGGRWWSHWSGCHWRVATMDVDEWTTTDDDWKRRLEVDSGPGGWRGRELE
ncbi:hypothetical protein HAX54_008826, partial [Datura stramonium]|nr:hypothetical protein [Datura stramonium]